MIRTPHRYLSPTVIALTLLAAVNIVGAEGPRSADPFQPRQRHPWAKFAPGSWSRVAVYTESMGADGQPTSLTITHTTTTLQAVSDSEITLQVESAIEMGGHEIQSPSQVLKKGYWGDPTAVVTVRETAPVESYEFPNQTVPIQRFQIEVLTEKTVCQQTVDYSSDHWPYILRRSIECFERPGKSPLYSTQVRTLAIDLPFRFRNQLLSVAHVETVQKLKQGELVSLESFCAEVPGGVVSHTLKELGESGQLMRRSVLELVDYHVEFATDTAGHDMPNSTETRAVDAQISAAGGADSQVPSTVEETERSLLPRPRPRAGDAQGAADPALGNGSTAARNEGTTVRGRRVLRRERPTPPTRVR